MSTSTAAYYSIPAVTFRPIEQWPGQLTPWDQQRPGRCNRAAWTTTIEDLWRELGALDARDVVVQLALTEGEIRRDGLPRANARPAHPGVILAFTCRHGPLQFACDTYDDFKANLRAVVLTLTALRAVDRYGATKTAEQYKGWAQIEAPPAGQMTAEAAAQFIATHAGFPGDWRAVMDDVAGARADAYRAAARRLHPDAGGTHELFTQLQAARRALDLDRTVNGSNGTGGRR